VRQAATAPLPFLDGDDRMNEDRPPAGIVLEGACPPTMLERILRATTPRAGTYAPPILVVQRDPIELLDGLARLDDADVIERSRVRFFVGARASEHLAAYLRSRPDVVPPDQLVRTPGLRTPATPDVASLLQRVHAEIGARQQRLAAKAAAIYAGRDPAFWRTRYADGTPLRVLVPVSRFTTFVRHAADDLARAMRGLGHDVRILTEPDDHCRLSGVAHLDPFVSWQPDLVVSINHPRTRFGSTVPEGVPFVCWIQDAMLHLFDAGTGAGHGPLDFVVGCLPPELVTQFGYPAARRLQCPVAASATKFDTAPAVRGATADDACDIAYVSHQSEPPEAMHQRLLDAARAGGVDATFEAELDSMLGAVRTIVDLAMDDVPSAALMTLARDTLEHGHGRDADPRAVAALYWQWCYPLAERMLRHETLGWAADLARAHGWRLRLYGRGWERHERLAEHAAGPLAHGAPLRSSYRTARVHLHLSMQTLVHQRVLECALSGGLPLCRLTMNEIATLTNFAMRRVASRPGRLLGAPATRVHGAYVADHPELMRLVALRQRLGLAPLPHYLTVDDLFLDRDRPFLLAEEQCADWLLGDLAETTFHSRATLEAGVRRAVEDEGWRERQSAFVRGRVHERLTHDAMTRRVLDLVTHGLGGR
jgi:hypothetical protein